MQRTEVDWQFYGTASNACLAMAKGCFIPRGKMLGGSSSMNWMYYMRGNQGNYDYWASLGNTEWNSSNVWEYFKKSENNTHAPFVQYENGKYHSDKGPLKVSFCGPKPSNEEIFKGAAVELGYPIIADANGNEHYGFTDMQGTIYGGRRQSTAKAFLIPAKNRTNLTVVQNAYVEKVLIDGENRAIGVQYSHNGSVRHVYARKEAILSAGVIMSPVLMMLSGIGPEQQLQKYNIPVKAVLPVGDNYLDHVAVVLFYSFDPTPSLPTEQLDGIYDFVIHSNGPFTAIAQLTAFINLQKNKTAPPEFQCVFVYFSSNSSDLTAFLQSMDYKTEIVDYLIGVNQVKSVAVEIILLLQPKSLGFIILNGTTAYDKPVIIPNYFDHPDDLDDLAKAMEQQVNFENTRSYRANGGRFIRIPLSECASLPFKSIAYNKCYIKYFSATAYHPVGTCKMGPRNDSTSVVDSRLRVHKVRKLRVIDASM